MSIVDDLIRGIEMFEEIKLKDQLFAMVLRSNYKNSGVTFFTPNNFSQQLAYMNHPTEKIIEPHVHNCVKREVQVTQEVLIIKKGKLRVDFYDDDRNYFKSIVLTSGDIVLLASGGHGFKVLEEVEMVEVKQGPYNGDLDKTKISCVEDSNVIF